MKHNVIFIEGLPGSGKTTFAKKLATQLHQKNIKVKFFQEGDLHPIDLAWTAVMDHQTFAYYKEKYPQLKDSLEAITNVTDKLAIIPYTKLDAHYTNQTIFDDFAQHEIYRTNDLNHFKNAHLALWNAFNARADKDTLYIFECVFLQNHINELILKHNLPLDQQKDYFQTLINTIEALNPIVYHITQRDVHKTLTRLINTRRTTNPTKYKDWVDLVMAYFNNQPYFNPLGYKGLDGFYNYFKDRQTAELKLLDTLNVPSRRYSLDNDYDTVFESMLKDTLKL